MLLLQSRRLPRRRLRLVIQLSIGHWLSLLLVEVSRSAGHRAHSGTWHALLGRLRERVGHIVSLGSGCASVDAAVVVDAGLVLIDQRGA